MAEANSPGAKSTRELSTSNPGWVCPWRTGSRSPTCATGAAGPSCAVIVAWLGFGAWVLRTSWAEGPVSAKSAAAAAAPPIAMIQGPRRRSTGTCGTSAPGSSSRPITDRMKSSSDEASISASGADSIRRRSDVARSSSVAHREQTVACCSRPSRAWADSRPSTIASSVRRWSRQVVGLGVLIASLLGNRRRAWGLDSYRGLDRGCA